MKFRTILLLLLCTNYLQVTGQVVPAAPRHTISLEYSYVPGIFLYGNLLPDNLEYSFRAGQKLSVQSGLFAQNADVVPGSSYFKDGFAIYGGVALKLHMFERHRFPAGSASFVPSVHTYADYFAENSVYDWTLTIGPTPAFEYAFSKRLSCRLDLLNINFGIGLPKGDFVATVHRLLGLALQYHFGMQ